MDIILLAVHILALSVGCNTLGSPFIGSGDITLKQKKHEKRKQGEAKFRQLEPWQLNEGTCPPVLCGSIASTLRDPDSQMEGVSSVTFPFFEGDIVLDRELSRLVNQPRSRLKRAIVRPIRRLWEYGIVPYVVDASLVGNSKSSVLKAMEFYQKKTCVTFIPKDSSHKNSILFTNQIGCWSYVGKRGGEQVLSLGKGCEDIGTVLHEMGHALGFWHEQSRPDRDKYVKIETKNISPKYISQFGKRTTAETTSRSFPYDYLSVMHYKDKDFSKNHRRTIKVIGVGNKLNLKIGQRGKLSDIDIAQINDMYYCNAKENAMKACNKGWMLYKHSCYRFVADKELNFVGASDYCVKRKGYLVHISNAGEDKFLKDHLLKHKGKLNIWRTGGKKLSGVFRWFDPGKKKMHKVMNFKSWATGYPNYYSTTTLALDRSKSKYVWKATWAGSSKNPVANAYPFICETKRNDKCFKSKTKDGRDYRGKINYTKSFITCQRWTSQYPHKHKYVTGRKDIDVTHGVGTHNNCRNPGGRRSRPWCFTSKTQPTWEYCDVNMC